MRNSVELLTVKTKGPEMLDATGQPIDQLKLVELAGRTCYKSQDKITADSAERFVKALIKSGHEAMIEFSWLTFTFNKKTFPDAWKWLLEVLKSEAHIIVTEKEGCFRVSGNFRSFRDLSKRIPYSFSYPEQQAIYKHLIEHYPGILEGLIHIDCETGGFCRDGQGKYYSFYNFGDWQPTDQEMIKHYFAAARFVGSRAFTHQLVRHRKSSLAQESQRYCDESGFMDNEYFILPPSIEEAGLGELYLTQLQEINAMHQKLLGLMEQAGLKGKKLKEDARFLLPNAVKSEICMAGNLEQWFRVFNLRLDSHAQWEIRGVMEKFKDQLFAAIPEAERLYEEFLKNPS
ncbi:MAG: FAD-dependent thymidylate synthase [Candidatus Buchananbacteria bacterium]